MDERVKESVNRQQGRAVEMGKCNATRLKQV